MISQKLSLWAAGRIWWWRLPIYAWFMIMFSQNIHDSQFAIKRLSNPFSGLDLGVHELGHIFFSPFGEFIHIAGGSLFQCIFPLLWFIGFWQKRWYFASSMCLCWLGLNLYDVATYAADARARLLPLATGLAGISEADDDSTYDRAHDWYQLLSRTHHLNSDLAIAQGLRIAGAVAFIAGFIMGGYLLIKMIINPKKPQTNIT